MPDPLRPKFMLDPIRPKLRTALLFVFAPLFAAATLPAHAAASSRARPQDAKPAAYSVEADARRAEESYERGEAAARRGDSRGALAALQEALRLYLHVYTDSKSPGAASPEASTRFRAEMAARLAHAPASVQMYERLGGADGMTDFERGQLDALRAHAEGFVESDSSRAVLFGREADARAVITYKAEPGFTEEARRKNVSGTVRLRAVLSADGEVRHVLVIKGLPSGLTERCVDAARRTKFTPAQKGGRPVSQFLVLEYNFSAF